MYYYGFESFIWKVADPLGTTHAEHGYGSGKITGEMKDNWTT